MVYFGSTPIQSFKIQSQNTVPLQVESDFSLDKRWITTALTRRKRLFTI